MDEFNETDVRIRLRAALAVLETVNDVLTKFPELTDLTTKRGRALADLKNQATRQLWMAWRREEI